MTRELVIAADIRPSFLELLSRLPRAGRLEWIGLRPAHRASMLVVDRAEAVLGRGLVGDHRSAHGGGVRQVTLIQAEHLPAIASLCGCQRIAPEWLRRNVVITGINLLALKDRAFRVGEVWLEGTGLCHPCSRMEEAVGPGAFQAMRGHGGITARVVRGGMLRVGDTVHPAEPFRKTW